MNALHFHTGNRMETLVETLAEVVAAPDPFRTPLEPEVVIVQSLGMSRWCSQQLARLHGVCLNVEFPFPRAWLRETLGQWLPVDDPFAPDLLGWRIFALLPELLGEEGFEPVRHYVGDRDGDVLKLYQLATRLAALFDQYLTYRPFWLLAWERGEQPLPDPEARWQARLWQELNRQGEVHLGSLLETLRQTMLPPGKRISIFGISSLPPAQMELFFHLAATRPVHLFLLSPSQEYFGDDLTPLQRTRRGLPESGPDDGNPLLTSLGRLHAQFTEERLELNEALGHRIVDETERWEEPQGEALLQTLQRDLFHARVEPVYPLETGDRSLTFHACHSPMREVEVLHDQLLALFEADPELTPGQVLVMAPDIETYAPLIQAVFGFPEEAALRIPFSIADRHPQHEHPEIDLFLRLLELPSSRCTGPQLFALMESGVFRERFTLDDTALEQIHHWTHDSGIRWGFSSRQREEQGLPPFEEATWRSGMDRLLLGYAMAGGNERLFEGILPCDDVEGGSAELLGRLITMIELLEETAIELSLPHALAEWVTLLTKVIDRFFPPGDAIRSVRDALGPGGRFEQIARIFGADPLPLEVVRSAISDSLGESVRHGRFLTGGVTFCALKPMRSIPAKVIWLLGMDDGAFPRRPPVMQFDLIGRHWQRGDRSPRDDDRYLFLEALLSARDCLGISYIGRSQWTNEPIPPSVVVGELLDYLSARLPEEEALHRLVTVHGLQAFSPVYYTPGSPLWSYSRANAVRPSPLPPAPFVAEPIPFPVTERAVTLQEFIRFFNAPAEAFLERRLGFILRDGHLMLEESERLLPNGLDRYALRMELLKAALNQENAPPLSGFRARTLVPPGAWGEVLFQGEEAYTEQFSQEVASRLGPKKEPQEVRLGLNEGVTLSGLLPATYDDRLVFFRPAKVKAKDRLSAWIYHLIRAVEAEGVEVSPTLLLGEDEKVQYSLRPEEARPILEALVKHFVNGMEAPLPFFPQSAWEYAMRMMKAKDPTKARGTALNQARAKWVKNATFNQPGEGDSLAHRLCFPEPEVIESEAFIALAEAIYFPMMDHSEDVEGRECS